MNKFVLGIVYQRKFNFCMKSTIAAIFLFCLCSCQKSGSFLEPGKTYEGWATAHEPNDSGYKKFTVIKDEGNGWIFIKGIKRNYWLNISAYIQIQEFENTAEQDAAANP